MKLTDLEPRWLTPQLFVFLCPHCRKWLLSCKSERMLHKDQWRLFEQALGENWNLRVVGSKPDVAWKIAGTDFATLSVHPSIDASPAGHWHGHIKNGQIVGGLQA